MEDELQDQEIAITVDISAAANISLTKRQLRSLLNKELKKFFDNLSQNKDITIVNHVKITKLKEEAEIYGNDEK